MTDTHLHDLSVAVAAAVPALLLVAVAGVCVVLFVAMSAAVGVTLAGVRTVRRRFTWFDHGVRLDRASPLR